MKFKLLTISLAIAMIPLQEILSQDCSHGATTSPKGNNLYLYFPTTADAGFEATISGVSTSPLAAFDVADLDATIGTTAQLRDRIFQLVTEDYCEFNVRVSQSTTSPATAGVTRWQIVGIGSDANGTLAGISALGSNTGDADPQDYTRVWAGTFESGYGPAGTVEPGVLGGANSTLERWATVISSTVSHEAAHNYGATHGNSAPRPGEDAQNNHLLATGGTGLTGEQRATRRHFSDTNYELLAHNIGLNIQTVYNWDFVNPNANDAYSLEITLLSSATTLTLSWWWNGTRSPWRDPTITSTGSTRSFQGNTYNEFILDFSTAKSWTGGSDGIVPGGAEFHIGAAFSESDLVIVYDTKLKDNGGTDLGLHPRMVDFNRGATDMLSGDFILTALNPDPGSGDLIIQDLNIQYLPRLASINSMVEGARLTDVNGNPITAHGCCNPRTNFDLKENQTFRLANLADERYVDIKFDSSDCKPGVRKGSGDDLVGEVVYCQQGYGLSLFPSTTIYVTATVIEPNARHFDPQIGDYVNGPLESKIFYQFTGIVPDFNKNGIDDLIDIREGTSLDENGNGIPDEVDSGQPNGNKPHAQPWWVYLIWIILIIIIIILLFNRRKKKG